MSLRFPNRSRSYDPAAGRIRFVGHDGVFEIPFSVETRALPHLEDGAASSETQYLKAFDLARATIYDVAREAYSNSRRKIYILTPADFV